MDMEEKTVSTSAPLATSARAFTPLSNASYTTEAPNCI